MLREFSLKKTASSFQNDPKHWSSIKKNQQKNPKKLINKETKKQNRKPWYFIKLEQANIWHVLYKLSEWFIEYQHIFILL